MVAEQTGRVDAAADCRSILEQIGTDLSAIAFDQMNPVPAADQDHVASVAVSQTHRAQRPSNIRQRLPPDGFLILPLDIGRIKPEEFFAGDHQDRLSALRRWADGHQSVIEAAALGGVEGLDEIGHAEGAALRGHRLDLFEHVGELGEVFLASFGGGFLKRGLFLDALPALRRGLVFSPRLDERRRAKGHSRIGPQGQPRFKADRLEPVCEQVVQRRPAFGGDQFLGGPGFGQGGRRAMDGLGAVLPEPILANLPTAAEDVAAEGFQFCSLGDQEHRDGHRGSKLVAVLRREAVELVVERKRAGPREKQFVNVDRLDGPPRPDDGRLIRRTADQGDTPGRHRHLPAEEREHLVGQSGAGDERGIARQQIKVKPRGHRHSS